MANTVSVCWVTPLSQHVVALGGEHRLRVPRRPNTKQSMLIPPEVHFYHPCLLGQTLISAYVYIHPHTPVFLEPTALLTNLLLFYLGTNKPFRLHFLRLLSLYSCKQKVAHSKYVDANNVCFK